MRLALHRRDGFTHSIYNSLYKSLGKLQYIICRLSQSVARKIFRNPLSDHYEIGKTGYKIRRSAANIEQSDFDAAGASLFALQL